MIASLISGRNHKTSLEIIRREVSVFQPLMPATVLANREATSLQEVGLLGAFSSFNFPFLFLFRFKVDFHFILMQNIF